ncbi:hypothetical protein PEC106664_02220 [Pectobacterium carotovorum subsp. carotovorum]|jgi:hypothetical protein|nr:hypothetical protein [Pectobacterium carotovorum subsp. carotovorum]PVY71649.1 hypothetical protein C7330_0656 [Pectobacterium versatile]GKV79448.1 hypothetical protein PEC106664_02220 [Pectobacterium carotovorum subsp. carotovorum]
MVGKSEGEYDTGQKSMMINKKHPTVSEKSCNAPLLTLRSGQSNQV